MKSSTSIVLALAAAALMAAPAVGQFRPGATAPQRTAEQLTRVRAMTDMTDPVMPGETFHVIVVFDIQPRWHLYWKNPGEGALPPQINLDVPDGFTVGEIRWPRPITIASPVGDMYCYENQVALFVPVTAPAELEDGKAAITADIGWAVCDKDLCLFGSVKRNVEVETTSSTVRTLEGRPVNPTIARHRQRLPKALDQQEAAEIKLRSNELRITGPRHDFDAATFFPLNSPGVTYGEPQFHFTDDRFEMMVDLAVNPNDFLDGPPKVGGLVALGERNDDPSYEFSMLLARQ